MYAREQYEMIESLELENKMMKEKVREFEEKSRVCTQNNTQLTQRIAHYQTQMNAQNTHIQTIETQFHAQTKQVFAQNKSLQVHFLSFFFFSVLGLIAIHCVNVFHSIG